MFPTGLDAIRVGDGINIRIQHSSDSHLTSSSSPFLLRNLLYVPSITKNLVFVLQFCKDNFCYFEFHASHFFVKDTQTQQVLLNGPTHNGLYVFPTISAQPNSPSTHLGEWASPTQWHRRMGHLSLALV